jgi:hypothetical protein
VNLRANSLVEECWSDTVGANAPLLAHTVLHAAPIAAAVVQPADGEVVVVGRPMGSRRDCAWAVSLALAPMWGGEMIPADVACRVVLSGTTYRTAGEQMRALAHGAGRAEWADAVEVLTGA